MGNGARRPSAQRHKDAIRTRGYYAVRRSRALALAMLSSSFLSDGTRRNRLPAGTKSSGGVKVEGYSTGRG
jgi:hypothetical protein